MAIFKSHVWSSISGTVGGIVYFESRAGLTARRFVVPVDTATDRQAAMRVALSNLAQRWNDVLTQTQRDAWATYAAQVPITGPLGDPRVIPPISHYIRSNAPRLQASMAVIDDAPTLFQLGLTPDLGDISMLIGAGGELDISWTAGQTGSSILLYISRPLNPGIKWYKGPFRFLTLAPTPDGQIIIPGTTGIHAGFEFHEGQTFFIAARVTMADGRLSSQAIRQGSPVESS